MSQDQKWYRKPFFKPKLFYRIGSLAIVQEAAVGALRLLAVGLGGDLGADAHGVGVEGGLAAGTDLLVDVGGRLGGVHGQLDADRLGVELARPGLGHVLTAVHLLVILRVLKT